MLHGISSLRKSLITYNAWENHSVSRRMARDSQDKLNSFSSLLDSKKCMLECLYTFEIKYEEKNAICSSSQISVYVSKMKFKTVCEGEQAVILNHRGEGRLVVGPHRVRHQSGVVHAGQIHYQIGLLDLKIHKLYFKHI